MGLDRLGDIDIDFQDRSEIFTSALDEQGLSYAFRSARPELWAEGLKQLNYYPISLQPAMIDYHLASLGSAKSHKVIDVSIVLLHDKKPCGLWSISLKVINGYVSMCSREGHLEPPVLLPSLGKRKLNEINKKCIAVVSSIAIKSKLPEIITVQEFLDTDSGISEWHDMLLRKGASVITNYDLFLDLKPDFLNIKSGLRSSYKSLINVGYKIWDIGILDTAIPSVWSEFRNLHKYVSGRVTRDESTWDLQYDAVSNGDAFLVYLRDTKGVMVGGALFYFSRDESIYAVGAYDRTLFDKPLGHVVQFHAIARLKELGIRWHKLGAQIYPSNMPTPSVKELAITDFKRGFASHIFPRYVINYAPQCK